MNEEFSQVPMAVKLNRLAIVQIAHCQDLTVGEGALVTRRPLFGSELSRRARCDAVGKNL